MKDSEYTRFEQTVHSCGRKHRYVSERIANVNASALTVERGVPLRTYRCPTCKGWHLTKTVKWN